MVLSKLEIRAFLDLADLKKAAEEEEWVGGGKLLWRGAYSYLLISKEGAPTFGKKLFIDDFIKSLPSMEAHMDPLGRRWLDTTESTNSLADWYLEFITPIVDSQSAIEANKERTRLNKYLTSNNLRQVI